MVSKELVIKNKSGLDSKPAVKFIQKASDFKASIWIERDERKVNAKSLLGLLSLSVASGEKIVLIADGEDENRAITELENYLDSGLGESI
ncbi:MAG TPA: HPr family phosphocarrier protein [Clostridia bacterium]|nr:HPr family phosphocarrier protein [Clostridia bacterium]